MAGNNKSRTKRSASLLVNTSISLPPPALDFDGLAKFLNTKGSSLLVKGYPGTGKTTLALQLITQLGGGNGVYISSRVSEEKISRQIPWLGRIERRPGEARGGSKKELGAQERFVDVRLGTSQSIVGEVLKAMREKKASIIVIDTWDGLAKEIRDEKERLKAEKTLIALSDSSRTRIVFVSEEPTRTTMDYLVDGIVELTRSEEAGRVIRELEIKKLRGTMINQHKYLYTLLDGQFRYIAPYSYPELWKAGKFEAREDASESKNYYSFGSADMDKIFGGIKKGTTFALEYGERVPYQAIRTIEIASILNFLNLGRSALLLPLPGASVAEICSIVKPFVSEDAFCERFRIAAAQHDGTDKNQRDANPSLFGIGQEEKEGNRREVMKTSSKVSGMIKELKSKSSDGSVFVCESVSLLENLFASDPNSVLEGLSERVNRIQQSDDALMLLLQSDSPMRSRVLAMSYQQAKLLARDRSIILMGEKPSTEIFALEHSRKNRLLPSLTRIV